MVEIGRNRITDSLQHVCVSCPEESSTGHSTPDIV